MVLGRMLPATAIAIVLGCSLDLGAVSVAAADVPVAQQTESVWVAPLLAQSSDSEGLTGRQTAKLVRLGIGVVVLIGGGIAWLMKRG